MNLAQAKEKALRAYTEMQERSLLKLCADLERAGYSQDEIIEVVEALGPQFREGAEKVLRQVTILSLMAEADNG